MLNCRRCGSKVADMNPMDADVAQIAIVDTKIGGILATVYIESGNEWSTKNSITISWIGSYTFYNCHLHLMDAWVVCTL